MGNHPLQVRHKGIVFRAICCHECRIEKEAEDASKRNEILVLISTLKAQFYVQYVEHVEDHWSR